MDVPDLSGLWTRTLLERPGFPRDVTTLVDWLQGPTLFADLRAPPGRPSFAGVRGLRNLDGGQVRWLARQQGFAGRLAFDGAFFTWNRTIDFQPKTGQADAGSLAMEGGIMVERGRDEDYVEHWIRGEEPRPPCAGFALRDEADGRAGFLVRAGADFFYVRDRVVEPPADVTLEACVESAPDLRRRQDLVDLEISHGRITAEGDWRIVRSSLPFREGESLSPRFDAAGTSLSVADVREDGAAFIRRWSIESEEGAPLVM